MNITCAAPLTSILIDTNKGIRPCCYYQAGFLGNLNKNSIIEIVKNETWTTLKNQMRNNEWPVGCSLCKKNEESFGTSLREIYSQNTTKAELDEEKITYIEFNGSNICNLSCLHCHSLYSSRWVGDSEKAKNIVKTQSLEKQKRALFE